MVYLSRFISAAVLSLFLASPVWAVLIGGDITFGGILNPATNLGTATSLDFLPNTLVTSVSGDLDSSINVADTVNFSDVQFNPFVPNNPLWSLGGFSFNLNSLSILDQSATHLALLGSGVMTAAGFDATPYAFSFSSDTTGLGAVAFSATNSAVPEPGSLLLLGSGLLGLAWLRWKRKLA